MQPLDKTFMRLPKVYCSEENRIWITNSNGTQNDTRLCPLNKIIFSYLDLIAVERNAVKDECTDINPTKSSSNNEESSENYLKSPLSPISFNFNNDKNFIKNEASDSKL